MSITALWKEEYPGFDGSQFRCFATSSITGATFYWYQDGTLVQSGTMGFLDVRAASGESVDIAVFDDSATVPPRSYQARAVLGFDAVEGAESYVIQQYVSGDWATVRTLPDRGDAYNEVLTDVLADETTHQFRVGAKGEDGNVTIYREFTFYWVRRPDPVDFVGTFDSSTGLTVDEAA